MHQWRCENCDDAALKRARQAEEVARWALERAARLDAEMRAAAEWNLQRAEAF